MVREKVLSRKSELSGRSPNQLDGEKTFLVGRSQGENDAKETIKNWPPAGKLPWAIVKKFLKMSGLNFFYGKGKVTPDGPPKGG